MADAISTLPNTKQELIRELALRELKAGANLLPTVSDYSQLAMPGYDKVSYPSLTSFTVGDRASGGVLDAQKLTDSKETLNLDIFSHIKWVVDGSDVMQSSINYEMEAVKRASSAIGRDVDSRILSAVNAAAAININGAIAADVTAANIRTMLAELLANHAMKENLVFVIGPDHFYNVLLGLTEFSQYQIAGVGATLTGSVGTVYGVPVVINSQLSGQQCYMYDKTTVAIAFQMAPEIASESDINYGPKGMRYVMEAVWGLKAVNLGQDPRTQGYAATESPLIAKLAD